MIKFRTLAFLLILFGSYAQAQIKTPLASPRAKLFQEVGLTEIEIEYCRPSAREREVFGHLVRFGTLWRVGANANTIVSFSEDVLIEGKALPKGHYSLYAIPNPNKWDLFFYVTTDNWGIPEEWDESKIALTLTLNPELTTEFVETLTFNFKDLTNKSAALELAWENTRIQLNVEVPTEEVVMKNIEKVLSGPSHEDYFAAAQYYYMSNKDAVQALQWIDKAIRLNGDADAFWYYRLKGLLHYKLGEKNKALEAVKQSLASAEKVNNIDYIKLNSDSIKDWSMK